MTTPTTTTSASPAIRADACSRITRLIADILQRRVYRNEHMSLALAAEIADELIELHGGDKLYVPTTDRRAGVKVHESIERELRTRLSADDLRSGGACPVSTVTDVMSSCGVSQRTVYRVLAAIRAES